MIIDTHCHLDDCAYFDNLDEILDRAKQNNVEKIVIPGADIADLKTSVKLCEKYENLYFAVGVHPYNIDNFDEKILTEFITHKKCVGVGECGLDYFRFKDLSEDEKNSQKILQKSVFEAQIKLAIKFCKPLILHIRDANEDAYKIIKKYANDLVGADFHCFNASPLFLEFKNLGFFYGIGGVLTFKNAKNLVEILPKIGIDNIIIETDGPYLSPEPNRGKTNEPAFTKFVVKKIAEILNLSEEKVENITTNNAKKLFKF